MTTILLLTYIGIALLVFLAAFYLTERQSAMFNMDVNFYDVLVSLVLAISWLPLLCLFLVVKAGNLMNMRK